jgi:lysozyme
MSRTINDAGLQIIKDSEGLCLKAYRCPSNIATIGYGHTGPDVHDGDVIDKEKAEELLRKDIGWAQTAVTNLTPGVDLNDNQFSALVSLVFNIGSGNFSRSPVLNALRNKKYLEAAEEFSHHVYGRGGIFLKGLEIRRKREATLFLEGIT